jgi:hypothetical protein
VKLYRRVSRLLIGLYSLTKPADCRESAERLSRPFESSDLHSEVADCRTGQGIKLLEEQISRTR